MKKLFFLMTLLLPIFSFAQVDIQGNLIESLNDKGREVIRQDFVKFLKHDFINSDYCQEGWGDGDAPERMQKACRAEVERIFKLMDNDSYRWLNLFHFEFAKIYPSLIDYQFEQTMGLSEDAPLSCYVSLQFKATTTKNILSKPSFDLYCDH